MLSTTKLFQKQSLSDLAIFGGKPLFNKPKPIGQLAATDVNQFLKTFKESYDARYLTNDGPLVRRLESVLCELHGVRHCIPLANAALGITMLIQIFAKGRRGEVIMPSFSYRGLPYFAQWAGQIPVFCDVDPETHTLNPNAVLGCINEQTTSILVVANFNSPGNIDGLCQVARSHNVPIFIDSVNAMGSTYDGQILGSFTNAEVFSLHATKLINGFEGGYITTNDNDLAKILRWQRNFSLPALSPFNEYNRNDYEHIIGLNAKLNEMHAALALHSIEQMDNIILRNRIRFESYCKGIAKLDGLNLFLVSDNEKRNYQTTLIEVNCNWPLSRDQTVSLLRAEYAFVSAYYSPPLHLSEHCPEGLKVPELPVSENLATKFIQLPVGDHVTADDIEHICQLLRFVRENGSEIAKRM